MASIRRTLSANGQDHPSQTQIQIQIQTSSPDLSPSPPFRRLLVSAMRLLFTFFHNTTTKKKKKPSPYHHRRQWMVLSSWRESFLCFSLFFILGSLLGLSPFARLPHPHLQPHHFFFDGIHPHHTHLGDIESPDPNLNRTNTNKLLIIVTPTYNRPLQAYYLTRLAHTLSLVPLPLLWIVVEMKSASVETAGILRRSGVTYRHLVADAASVNIKDRGVHQRNTALRHIETHHLDGIVYFADDDNIYSLQLFHQLRSIRRFGTWPVAMLAQGKSKAILEGPVCNGSQVIGWHTNEKSKRLRRFHVDMSGFAFNSTILWDPTRWGRLSSNAVRQLDSVKEGFQETTFIEQVVEDESQMEGLPHDCSMIMNWHLHLDARHLFYPKGWKVSQNLDVINSLR